MHDARHRRFASPNLHTVSVAALADLPQLVHGFEQRRGAIGKEGREASKDRVSAALAPWGRLLLLRQRHGASVQHAPWAGRPEGDAAICERDGWLLGIETADCVPILLVDPRRKVVAAAHAGWRGTVLGIVQRTVEALIARGSRPSDLVVAMGPAIGPCCYEVGPEVEAAFAERGSCFIKLGSQGRPHLDLRAANLHQLLESGVESTRIHQVNDCTFCRADLYPSYRRDGHGCGRMISFVGFR